MFKNVATKIALFAFDSATGLAKTGDAANITPYVSKDYGSVTALADTSATEMSSTNAKGWYLVDVAQAETNADSLIFSGKSSTSGIEVVGQYIFTTPNRFSGLAVDSTGAVAAATGVVRKGVALSDFPFKMTLVDTQEAAEDKTVTVLVKLDGNDFEALTDPTVTQDTDKDGWYTFDLGTADTNGNMVSIKATATGCNPTEFSFRTTP